MTLVIGYGNPGRGDDGIGPKCAQKLARRSLPGVEVLTSFQLVVEHAHRVAKERCVIFVDATMDVSRAFTFETIAPVQDDSLGSHAMSPGGVLTLSQLCFGQAPEAHVLAIAGVRFGDIHDGLSPQAEDNLARAEAFLARWLQRARTHSVALQF